MHLVRTLSLIVSIALVCVASGCDQTTTPAANNSENIDLTSLQDPTPSDLAPYIYGRSSPYSEELGPLAANTGMTVHLEGTNFTTMTDSLGWWIMKYVPAGIYIVDLSRPGYGSRKLYNIQYLGRGHYSLGNTWLNPLPKGFVPVIESFNGNEVVAHCIDTSFHVINGDVPFKFFYSKHREFDPSDPSTYQRAVDGPSFPYSNQRITIRMNVRNNLDSMGFKFGDSVFVRMFEGEYGDDNYIDLTTGQRVYTLYPYERGASVAFKYF
jgi:hypothetical protein